MLLICTETTRRKWVWISFLFWHPSVCVCARSCVRARTRVCETSITSPLSRLSLGLLTSQRLTVAPLSPLQPVRLHIRIRFNRENKNIYLSRYIPNIAYSLHCCCFFYIVHLVVPKSMSVSYCCMVFKKTEIHMNEAQITATVVWILFSYISPIITSCTVHYCMNTVVDK